MFLTSCSKAGHCLIVYTLILLSVCYTITIFLCQRIARSSVTPRYAMRAFVRCPLKINGSKNICHHCGATMVTSGMAISSIPITRVPLNCTFNFGKPTGADSTFTLFPDPFSRAQTESSPVCRCSSLSDEDTVIHLAMHFAGHLIEREARLNQLLDLGRFVHQTAPLDWDLILQNADAANVTRFVYASLFLAHKIFHSPLPPESVWKNFALQTPPAFRNWLNDHGEHDVLTSNYRQRHKGKDYQLTFLAARTFAERLGIIRFATMPPAAQLMAKYKTNSRLMIPFLYARHFVERVVALI